MPSLIWNAGATVSCTQTLNKFEIVLSGSAYWDGPSGGTNISYAYYINGERKSLLSNNKATFYISQLPAGASQFTIEIAAEKTYSGTRYSTIGPSKVQTVTNYLAWDSGTDLQLSRNTSDAAYVRGQIVGGAHPINGASGTIDYLWNIYLDPTATTPSSQKLTSVLYRDFDIVNELGGYDKAIAITAIGRIQYSGAYFYTTELPKENYFTYSGKLVRRYNGSTWKDCEVYYYVGNGTGNYGTNNNWQRVQPMLYNGSSFVQNIY